MSHPHSNPVVSTHYFKIQIELPDDAQPSGNVQAQGLIGTDGGSVETGLLPSGGSNNAVAVGNSSPRKESGKEASEPPQSSASSAVNLTPSINTAPIALSGGNCYFQTRDFLSEEAKQAAANLRDTMAAIADKRSLFFSECPKSPKHSLDAVINRNPSGSSTASSSSAEQQQQQPPALQAQRSSLLLEKNKDGEQSGLLSLSKEHPRLTPERTMSGFYFPNASRRPGTSGRMSLKTFELIKNCPSLELYISAPVTALSSTPPVNLRPKAGSPLLQDSPHPPTLSLSVAEPVNLEVDCLKPALATGRPSSSPDNYLRVSNSPSDTAKRRATTNSREEIWGCSDAGKEALAASEGLPAMSLEQNGERAGRKVGGPSASSQTQATELGSAGGAAIVAAKPQAVAKLHEVRFFSAPDALPFQETEGKAAVPEIKREVGGAMLGVEKKRHQSGDDSLPSTPTSGSLSTSLKNSSINKIKAFFTDSTSSRASSSSEGKQGDNSVESGADASQTSGKASASNSKQDRGSFKSKKSNSKHHHQLQVGSTSFQGSPGSKHKKSPTDKGDKVKEPQVQKESWKGRVARTIKRYGSGSILLSGDASTAMGDDKSSKFAPKGVFGVPLDMCEGSPNFESVPLIVEICVKIVEEKGLDNQGIYRVPGNTGAIKELQEEINRDPKGLCLDSEKWQDVNLVTSLLKLFFRKLPDSLITDKLYESVIATSRLEKSEKRMLKLKKILHDMPERNFNTFAFLTKHLLLVAKHEENNKMDAHNLAIMFGPTLIRPRDNNIAIMARNMADQCRIIETIICNCDWFFSSWDEDVNVPLDASTEEPTPFIDEKMVAKAQSLALYTHTL